ncbi:MAG: TlpA family protein disulfide reductase [Thermoguttaceae bacterium]
MRHLLLFIFFVFFLLNGSRGLIAADSAIESQVAQIGDILQKNPNLLGAGQLVAGDKDTLNQLNQSCTELLRQSLSPELRKWTVAVQLRVLLTLYMQNLTIQPDQVKELRQLLIQLENDEAYRPLIAKCEQQIFRGQLLAVQQSQAGDGTDRYAVEKAIKEYAGKNFTKEAEQTVKHLLQVAKDLAEKDTKFAVTTYMDMAEIYAKSKFEDDVTYSKKLQGAARRLGLPGNPMPFVGVTPNGTKINSNDFKDKVVLVDFWASWCQPCLASIPVLKDLYKKYRGQGFEIVGVNVDNTPQDLQKYVDKEIIPWTQICDSSLSEKGGKKISDYYGVTELPTLILIGKNGKVVATDFGLQELSKKLQQQLSISRVPEQPGLTPVGTGTPNGNDLNPIGNGMNPIGNGTQPLGNSVLPLGNGAFGPSSSLNLGKDDLQTPDLFGTIPTP